MSMDTTQTNPIRELNELLTELISGLAANAGLNFFEFCLGTGGNLRVVAASMPFDQFMAAMDAVPAERRDEIWAALLTQRIESDEQ